MSANATLPFVRSVSSSRIIKARRRVARRSQLRVDVGLHGGGRLIKRSTLVQTKTVRRLLPEHDCLAEETTLNPSGLIMRSPPGPTVPTGTRF